MSASVFSRISGRSLGIHGCPSTITTTTKSLQFQQIPRSQLQLHLCWTLPGKPPPAAATKASSGRVPGRRWWQSWVVMGNGYGWWWCLWMAVVMLMVNHSQKPWILVDDPHGLVVIGYWLVTDCSGWLVFRVEDQRFIKKHHPQITFNHLREQQRHPQTSASTSKNHPHICHICTSIIHIRHGLLITRPLVSIKTALRSCRGRDCCGSDAWLPLLFQCPGW